MSTIVAAGLAALSGVLLALAFPYTTQPALAWVGLAPLLYALGESRRGRRAFLLGWVAGFAFFGVLLYWISVFGWIAWISLSSAQAFFIGLFGLLAWHLYRRWGGWGRLLFVPAAWVAVEYLRSLGPWGFPWGILGSSVRNLPILQFASVGGEYGLSFIIAAAGVLVAEAFGAGSWRPVLKQAAVVTAALLALYGFGLTSLGRPLSTRSFKVALVQGSIPQSVKFDPAFEEETKRIYLRLTRRALRETPYLVIWPETAYPGFLLDDPAYLERLRGLGRTDRANLLVGSFVEGSPLAYNAAILLSPAGGAQIYRKIHLVPFGEVIPFRSLVGRINALAAMGEDLAAGRDFVTLRSAEGEIASVICFESSDGLLVRRLIGTRKRAALLVTITNDAWFKRTAAAEQHFQLSRIRAVENRVFAIQAANTGISGIFDPFGRQLSRTELGQRRILVGTAGFTGSGSIYGRIAGIEPIAVLAIVLSGMIMRSRRDKPDAASAEWAQNA